MNPLSKNGKRQRKEYCLAGIHFSVRAHHLKEGEIITAPGPVPGAFFSVAAFARACDIQPRKDAAAFMESTTLLAFVAAGIFVLNPDAPGRPATSPHTLYQVPYPVFIRLVAMGLRIRPIV